MSYGDFRRVAYRRVQLRTPDDRLWSLCVVIAFAIVAGVVWLALDSAFR